MDKNIGHMRFGEKEKMSHPRDQKTKAVFALVITSDSRTEKEDETGKIATELITSEGHQIAFHTILPNNIKAIQAQVRRLLEDSTIHVIITSGGTGLSVRDKTIEAVKPIFEKDMPGFGETFRRLSFEEVGGSALLSRAIAGVVRGKVIYCLPGSKNAMSLALNKLILPNIGHTLWELNRA